MIDLRSETAALWQSVHPITEDVPGPRSGHAFDIVMADFPEMGATPDTGADQEPEVVVHAEEPASEEADPDRAEKPSIDTDLDGMEAVGAHPLVPLPAAEAPETNKLGPSPATKMVEERTKPKALPLESAPHGGNGTNTSQAEGAAAAPTKPPEQGPSPAAPTTSASSSTVAQLLAAAPSGFLRDAEIGAFERAGPASMPAPLIPAGQPPAKGSPAPWPAPGSRVGRQPDVWQAAPVSPDVGGMTKAGSQAKDGHPKGSEVVPQSPSSVAAGQANIAFAPHAASEARPADSLGIKPEDNEAALRVQRSDGPELASPMPALRSETGGGLTLKPQTQAPAHDMAMRITAQVTEAVQRSGGQSLIEVTLQPEELGRVTIALTNREGATQVTVIADRADTLDLMRRHSDDLEQQFRDLGFENLGFAFAQQDEASAEDGRGRGYFKQNEGDEEASAPAQPRSVMVTCRLDIRL